MNFDVIIIGAGAAGMMAAARAGSKGKSVLLIDHAKKIGEKIRISGGGRCNFTNIHTTPANFLSQNPHFCKSALARYTPKDFISLVQKHGITYHDKGQGQLFCDDKATQIVDMLVKECEQSKVIFWTGTAVQGVQKNGDGFAVATDKGVVYTPALVVATGGLSIPKIGATSFGYKIAEQFGHAIIPTRAALVPLTFTDAIAGLCAELTGLSVDPSVVSTGKTNFREALLFTHRGLSGPAILQISSFWREGNPIHVNLVPHIPVPMDWLKAARTKHPRKLLHTVLEELLPARLALAVTTLAGTDEQMANMPDKKLAVVADILGQWTLTPAGTEGYRTAEVTLGGVDTSKISSQNFKSKLVSGLYFVGEVLDVTGHLGGFNFQWAWSSGWCCGEEIAQ